ncbi:hypothetical protein [Arthrobacter cavernae]|uniref:Uncharacterized protein n=1 Tax=Arthrobacter cavernae TaxID=2817681 RepID=A0A939HH13_9MICC|nr:hypothetical protein [Arthrobacter cavernae]MBO1268128.1 hypothetical protein [Arthrobacter cavernae]
MTCRNIEREKIVDDVMLDAGLRDAPALTAVLNSLGSFATMPAPAPGAELAAMLAGPTDDLSKRRWLRNHRPAVVGVAVLAAMGLGVSGVAAASSGFSERPEFVDRMLESWAPAWTVAPTPAQPQVPVPDAPKVTTAPAPTVDPAAVPPAEQLTAPAVPAPKRESAPAEQAAVPAVPAVPAPKRENTTETKPLPEVPKAEPKNDQG